MQYFPSSWIDLDPSRFEQHLHGGYQTRQRENNAGGEYKTMI